ncbi:aldehyde dehydrogenase family protein [Sphingobium sp.]|uniref:aldehyde dehydrogenase family protein n=1 Tax=Sphingobium sp. TaxID=1912891 RepID=UPI00262F6046|nr:aldehyde dehydrogenase family protein [Sphingobium sp.]
MSSVESMIASHPYLQGAPKRMLIDGQWVEAASGETMETINPSTGKVLASFAKGGDEDVNRAVAAARRAFDGPWSKVKPMERQAMLLKLADLVDQHFEELMVLDTLEMGAPISRIVNNRFRAVGMLRYYAGQAVSIRGDIIPNSIASGDFISYAAKEPVGVVAAIIAWNSPLTATILKLGPILAAGCTAVVKPSEEACLSPLRFAELIAEAGFPAGVVNVVTGLGSTVGAALSLHQDVDKLAFTGSTATGQKLIQASAGNIKRLALELGGKSAHIVFSDADMDAALNAAAMGIFGNSGQSCGAGSRLFVERKIYDEFVQRVAEFGNKLKVGDAADPATQMGPLVSKAQLDRVSSYIAAGKEDGAKMISGGERLTEGNLGDGFFIPPTVFRDASNDMRISQEEIFGPVLSAMPFDEVDEVIGLANRINYGLGGGVWTQDIKKAMRLAQKVRTGQFWVNCYGVLDPSVPHGGMKMSGFGREQGPDHIYEFLDTKSVWIKTS